MTSQPPAAQPPAAADTSPLPPWGARCETRSDLRDANPTRRVRDAAGRVLDPARRQRRHARTPPGVVPGSPRSVASACPAAWRPGWPRRTRPTPAGAAPSSPRTTSTPPAVPPSRPATPQGPAARANHGRTPAIQRQRRILAAGATAALLAGIVLVLLLNRPAPAGAGPERQRGRPSPEPAATAAARTAPPAAPAAEPTSPPAAGSRRPSRSSPRRPDRRAHPGRAPTAAPPALAPTTAPAPTAAPAAPTVQPQPTAAPAVAPTSAPTAPSSHPRSQPSRQSRASPPRQFRRSSPRASPERRAICRRPGRRLAQTPPYATWSDGAYRLQAREVASYVAIAAPNDPVPPNVLVSATLRKTGGPPGGGYGLIVRNQSPEVPRRQQPGASTPTSPKLATWASSASGGARATTGSTSCPGRARRPYARAARQRVHRPHQWPAPVSIDHQRRPKWRGSTMTSSPMVAVGVFAGGDNNEVALDRFTVQVPY